MDISIVALIASVFSIGLAIVAIWQANHHRDQSDKLNRDTTEKLAKIETLSLATKDLAFRELTKYGDYFRTDKGIVVEKEREDELKKVRELWDESTSQTITTFVDSVKTKIDDADTISKIQGELEDLRQDITKIQERAVTDLKDVEKRSIISSFVSSRTPLETAILTTVAKKGDWIPISYLKDMGYDVFDVWRTMSRAAFRDLAQERSGEAAPGIHGVAEFKLDKDLRDALLRKSHEVD